MTKRTAKVLGGTDLKTVRSYLPTNYTAHVWNDGDVLIEGYDDHGWTLDGYVIPRLGSGLIVAVEIDNQQEETG